MEDQQPYEATNTAIQQHINSLKETIIQLQKIAKIESLREIITIKHLLHNIEQKHNAHAGTTDKITREQVSCYYPCSPSDWTGMCRHRGCNPD